MTALPPARILALVGPRPATDETERTEGLLEEVLGSLEAVVQVVDLEGALDRLEQLGGGQDRTVVAVVGPEVARPLSAARELRRARPSLHLVFVVPASIAEETEVRLGLMPELRGADVVVAEESAEAMRTALLQAASEAGRRQDVRSALDAINRQLLQGAGAQEASTRGSVSQSYLAALIHHVPEAIVSVDGRARIVTLNDAAAGLLAIDRHGAEGEALSSVAVSGSAAGAIQRLVEDALAGVVHAGREVELQVGDGPAVLASFTAAPVRDQADDVVGAVLVGRDVTEQRRAEDRLRELQKAQSLATLAGGVAHDFNNLLVTVSGWAELAADDIEDTELVATALERIRVAAHRAAELARSMLVYSGRGRFEPQPVDLSELVRELGDLLRGGVHRKARLEFVLANGLPTVEADASQIRQVVMNLVTNAAEALGDEAGTITVRTRRLEVPAGPAGPRQPAPGAHVAVEVVDTGPGMAPEIAERVFEPFFSTKFEGRGLGLAASDGIARAHGGMLTVETEPGRGARFRLLLPVPPEGAGP